MRASVVYQYEGDEEGGTAHPTQDLIAELGRFMEVDKVPVRSPRSSNPLYWYRLGKRASEDADVVHVQFEYATFGSLGGIFLGIMYPIFALGVSVPMVTTFFNLKRREVDVTLSEPRTWLDTAVLLVKSPIDWALVRSTSFFIPFIREQERILRDRGVAPERIERIPLVAGTDPEFLDSDECKREYGIEGMQVVTAFGWVRRSKGYHHVIDSLERLPDDTAFLVAGGTRIEPQEEYLEELERQARERGLEDRVVFTGYVPREEHPTVMNATDVMVFPYQDNRPSAALAAALSYHLAIIASDSEVFATFEEEWGCVRTCSIPDGLTACLDDVLTDEGERERLERRAREYADEVNCAKVAERLDEIYRQIA